MNGRICSAKVSQQIAWLNNRYVGSSGQEAPSCISLPSLQSPKTRFPTPDTPDLEPLIHDPQSNIKTSSSGPRPNASRSKSFSPKAGCAGLCTVREKKAFVLNVFISLWDHIRGFRLQNDRRDPERLLFVNQLLSSCCSTSPHYSGGTDLGRCQYYLGSWLVPVVTAL